MNVLYIGVENPVSFAVESIKCSELTMIVENGSAKRSGECDYDVMVTKPGAALIFLIKGKDTIYKTTYRVKKIPNPRTTWGKDESYWLLDSLRSQSALSPNINNFDFDAIFSIVSFEITVVRNKKRNDDKRIYCDECFKKIGTEYYEVIFSKLNEGGDFNDLFKEFIQHEMRPGDNVFLDNIKARGPDKMIRHLGSINFKVE
jgi:hypothetical protein